MTARASFLASETGSGLVEVAVMLPVLLLLMIGTLDVGRGYYYAIEINDAAEAGALYGSQNPSDTAGMVAAATLNAPDISGGITTSAAYGCECSNGTGLVAGCAVPPGACSTSYVQYVQVNTSWTYPAALSVPGNSVLLRAGWPGHPASESVTSLHRIRNAALLERLRHFRQDQRGDALIEFAISVTVMLTMVFGVMDFSRAVYVYHFLPYAAGQGIRYAAVRGSTWGSTTCTGTATLDCAATSANIISYVQSIAPPGVTASTLTVTTTWPGTTPSGSACISTNGVNSPNCLVKVSVSCPFSFVLPFLPSTALTFAASSEQIILE